MHQYDKFSQRNLNNWWKAMFYHIN